ncbi:MAG: hypothetical protein OXU69_03375 [Gemmatimonadota bacterium]|nr:hypothetical protein [Gemmatimonadota bacterium]MDE2983723.1 hypothetical protein [Gemmatimonadota bacterium]
MKRFQDVALSLLVLAIIARTLHVMVRAQSADDTMVPAPTVLIGDTVPALTGYAEDGVLTTVSLDSDSYTATVVYAFHPECVFCDLVASEWAAHFAAGDPKAAPVRRIAVTRELPGPAATHAQQFNWDIDLLSVSGSVEMSPEAFLVSRTPWVYVFDRDGVLRFHADGAEVEHVDQAMAEIASLSEVARRSESTR